MRIALYCPLKPPHHPIPTGDRTIARNLVSGISAVGHDVILASDFIAYMKRPDLDLLVERKAAALAEADAVIARLADAPPDVWLTYHPYDKAPDWIGPTVCDHYEIPYLTVEAARTAQPGFAAHRAAAQAGIQRADLHMVMKGSDRDYLAELLGSDAKLRPLPPFIDTFEPRFGPVKTTPVLLAVGQMRPGKKAHNFRMLADALKRIADRRWSLVLVGDGPARAEVNAMFAPFGDRVIFTGAVSRDSVVDEMAAADIFVWPGWREPIGMVYLEAQSLGLPIAAFADMGVPLVVAHGETGLLAQADDVADLSASIARLLGEPGLRATLGRNGPAHVRTNHSLLAAGQRLDRAFREALGEGTASG
ncbi:MAG: glycosyltransferase family 4 protein [Pseudomonadota bacterium]